MAIWLRNNKMANGEIGVRVNDPKIDVMADGNSFDGVKVAFDLGKSASLMDELGLPKDTPPDQLLQLLLKLKAMGRADDESKRGVITESRLARGLRTASEIGSVLTAIMALDLDRAIEKIKDLFR